MTRLPEETKDKLMEVLSHAASQEKAVIEFTRTDDTLYATEITEHVNEMEEMVND